MRNLQARGEGILRKVTVNSHEYIETLKGSYDAVGSILTICLFGFIEDGFRVVVVKQYHGHDGRCTATHGSCIR